MGCLKNCLDQDNTDLPLSDIFATRGRQEIGKSTQKRGFWLSEAYLKHHNMLMACLKNRLDEAETDLPLWDIFATRGRQEIGKSSQKRGFWLSEAYLKRHNMLMGCHLKRMEQAIQIQHFQTFSPPGGARKWENLPKREVLGSPRHIWSTPVSFKGSLDASGPGQ